MSDSMFTEALSRLDHRHTLFEEKFSCILSSKNPAIRDGMSLETYLQMKHCLVTISNFGVGVVDTILAQKKLKRNVVLRVPHFLAVSYIIGGSDLIATLPHRLCELISRQENVRLVDPPLKIPKFPIHLYWHVRNQENPIHKWFRKLIRDSV